MKLSAGQVEGFCAEPAADMRVVLLYGPDRGLVAERLERIFGVLAPDPDDPFRVARMDGVEVGSDMASFLDEAAQIPLDGARRVIRIRHAGDAVAPALDQFLGSDGAEAVVLVQAGDLGPRSALRNLCERSELAVALPCYRDDDRDIGQLLRRLRQSHGVQIDDDAFAYLVDRLGRDRGVTRSELEKLALFAADGGPLDYESAAALVGDSALLGADTLADAAGLGQAGAAFRSLQRLHENGMHELTVLRMLIRHFQLLHVITAAPHPHEAIESVRPAIHFKRKPAVRMQAGKWSGRRIEHVLRLLGRSQQMCLHAGLPGPQVLQETVLRILMVAHR